MIERKEDILKVSAILFSESGYDNTSTRELAKAVDLSIAGLYYFFPSKEEILFNILDSSIAELLESVRSAIKEDDDPQINIARAIEYMVKHVIARRMNIGLLIKESNRLNPKKLEIISDKERGIYKLIRDEILRLSEQGRLKSFHLVSLTFAVIAIVQLTYRWFDLNGSLTVEEFVAEMIDLFFYGVLKPSDDA